MGVGRPQTTFLGWVENSYPAQPSCASALGSPKALEQGGSRVYPLPILLTTGDLKVRMNFVDSKGTMRYTLVPKQFGVERKGKQTSEVKRILHDL